MYNGVISFKYDHQILHRSKSWGGIFLFQEKHCFFKVVGFPLIKQSPKLPSKIKGSACSVCGNETEIIHLLDRDESDISFVLPIETDVGFSSLRPT